jgi:hypothetical protein
LLVGAALLLLGRQLYWLFVAGVGFVVTMELVSDLAQIESTLLILILALAAGIVGALLAVFLQKVGIGIAGFLAGAYAVLVLLDYVGVEAALLGWILAIVGGVLGAILTLVLFDWALIVISSLMGGWMITQGLNLANNLVVALVFVIIVAIGVAIQGTLLRHTETRTD